MLYYSVFIISIMFICKRAFSYQEFRQYSLSNRGLPFQASIISHRLSNPIRSTLRQLSMVEKSEKEWMSVLTPNQFSVLRLKATGQQDSFYNIF